MSNFIIDLPNIIGFYITTLILGLIGTVVTTKAFKDFPDKGYGFNRIVSLLIIGYISWILTFLNLNFSPLYLLVLLAGLALFYVIKINKSYKFDLKTFLITEAIFIVCYAFMIFYRGSNSSIKDIEKFMDFAIYNGLYRGASVPPQDVWYSGLPINYYYFGHYVFANLNRITKITTSVSYNLNIALLFGISTTAMFSVVYRLTKKIIPAILASLLLVLGGNLHYIIQLLTSGAPNYFYADARSLIKYGITEFPSYSFVISDFHAHIIDIPFVILMLATLINLWNSTKMTYTKIITVAFVLGVLFTTNSWDFFIYIPLLFAVSILSLFVNKIDNKIENIVYILSAVPLAIIIFLPYHLYFHNITKGIGFRLNIISPEIMFTMFGFFIITFVLYLLAKKQEQNLLVYLITFYSAAMILIPSFLYLKDIYSELNPPYYRANTIFKFWYQAWIMLCFCFGYYVTPLFKLLNKRNFVLLPITLMLMCGVFVYPIKAYKYVIGPKYTYKGLDGAKYLANLMPGEKRVIEFINQNIKGQPKVLEAAGGSYSVTSVISSYTGLPTVIGWNEHELGWRNNWPEIANRLGDVEIMYKSDNPEVISKLISKYHIQMAVIGFNEREKYGVTAGEKLQSLAKNKMFFGDTTLLYLN